jgi:hypothetical protein
MVERKIIVDHLTIAYKGLFDLMELYKLIDFFFMEKAYTKHELKNYEIVLPHGKTIHIETEPYKKITDYAKYVTKVYVDGTDIQEVEIEKDGINIRMNQGEVKVAIIGTLETDYERRWEQKPIFFFLRGVFDRFIFRVHTYKWEVGLIEECNLLSSQVKGFLNLYRY